MALRRGPGLLAGLIATVAAGALACGGDSPLDIPTPTTVATAVTTLPTQPPAVTPTTAPVTPTQQVGGQQEYTIQAGDTLGTIATQFGVTVDAIAQANNISDPNLIVVGDTLIIPAAP